MKKTTKSLCNICLKTINALKYEKDNCIYIEKTCPEHGTFVEKIAKDAKRFFDKTYTSETKPFTSITKYNGNCGQDCGWCEEHKQHICTGLIEITDVCNLKCPICYFGKKAHNNISLEEFKSRIETLLKIENGHLDILQLSGGECTLHPEFLTFIDEALKYDIRRIVINTNGLAFLENEILFEGIKKLNDKIDVYLQFDGFNDEIYKTLRGKALLEKKLQIIDKLNAANIKMHLAVTVYKNNLSEIPKILEFATRTKHVSGITFQRLTKTGCAKDNNTESVFQEDILLAMTKNNYLKYQDIIPLPCSHENCTSLAFLLCLNDEVYSMGDYVNYKNLKPAISNRLVFDETVINYLKDNICSCFVGKMFGNDKVLNVLKNFAKSKLTTDKDAKIIRIVVKNFMDVKTFDWERAQKCCTAIAVGNNKVIPFCVNNTLKGEI